MRLAKGVDRTRLEQTESKVHIGSDWLRRAQHLGWEDSGKKAVGVDFGAGKASPRGKSRPQGKAAHQLPIKADCRFVSWGARSPKSWGTLLVSGVQIYLDLQFMIHELASRTVASVIL